MRIRSLTRLVTVTAFAVMIGISNAAFAAPDSPKANPPVPVVEAPSVIEGFCSFPVQFQVSGKAKTIELPGNRFLFTSPGLDIVVTNLDKPQNTVTLNITGAFHQTTLPNGDVRTVSTGRSILLDPIAGFAFVQGRFSFAFDKDGNLIEPLNGNGQVTNLCVTLA